MHHNILGILGVTLIPLGAVVAGVTIESILQDGRTLRLADAEWSCTPTEK